MSNKIYDLIRNENKKTIVYGKLCRLWQGIVFKNKFGEFGKNSVIYSCDRLIGKKHIFIGTGVTVLHHARIEALTYSNKMPRIIIGNNTLIGQNLHLIASDVLKIGNDVTISGNVFISDTAHAYNEIDKHSIYQNTLVSQTEIGDYCFLGYGASIQPGVKLGKQCIVGTNSVVLKGIYDDYSILAGVPAKVIKRYNSEKKEWERV